jgi:D-sedoheptulose 7-phosphate isomerase
VKAGPKKLFEDCLSRFRQLERCRESLITAFNAICECYRNGGKLLTCGNGGSASDAEHITCELMKKFRIRRDVGDEVKKKLFDLGYSDAEYISSHLEKTLPAISLVSQTSLITAVVNDTAGDMIYAQQVFGYGKAGDILWVLSCSGNSPNILNAVKVARMLDMVVIGFTGESGGALAPLCQIPVCFPSSVTACIQEMHLPAYHLLCAMVEEEFFGV